MYGSKQKPSGIELQIEKPGIIVHLGIFLYSRKPPFCLRCDLLSETEIEFFFSHTSSTIVKKFHAHAIRLVGPNSEL